jgi:hypothetical protein
MIAVALLSILAVYGAWCLAAELRQWHLERKRQRELWRRHLERGDLFRWRGYVYQATGRTPDAVLYQTDGKVIAAPIKEVKPLN